MITYANLNNLLYSRLSAVKVILICYTLMLHLISNFLRRGNGWNSSLGMFPLLRRIIEGIIGTVRKDRRTHQQKKLQPNMNEMFRR